MADNLVEDPEENPYALEVPAHRPDHLPGAAHVGDADARMDMPGIEGGGKKCSCCKKSPCMCGKSCRKCRGKMGGDCACGAGTKMGGGSKRSKSKKSKSRSKSRGKARSKSRSRK